MAKKIVFTFVIFSLMFFSLAPVLADGIMIMPDPEETVWDQVTGQQISTTKLSVGRMVGENAQQAFIAWDDKTKTEKMMIIVDKEQTSYRNRSAQPLFWIVPIKSDCEDITPHHYEKFSESIETISLNDEAKNRMKKAREAVLGMQIWPLLSKLTEKRKNLQRSPTLEAGLGSADVWGGANLVKEQVQVYETIESYGVRTEVLSAQSTKALEEYLRQNNIKLGNDLTDVIDSYVGNEYCFAVSKVTNPSETGKLGVMLEFKPGEIFYPLYITSAYGERRIRVEVYARGSLKAEMSREKQDTEKYYLKGDFTYGKDKDILFEKGDVITKVYMNSRASEFTGDLYFEKSALLSFYSFFKLYLWLFMIIIALLISFLLAILLFRKRWILVGIMNGVFGIIGLIVASLIKNIRKTSLKEMVSRSSEEKVFRLVSIWNKIIIALPLFMLALIPIGIFGGYEVNDYIGDIFETIIYEPEFAAIFFAFTLPVSFLLALSALLMKKIIKANRVDIAARQLLADIMIFVINIFEALMIFASIILFIAMGPTGWVLGILAVITLLGYINLYKSQPIIVRMILAYLPFVFIILGFMNIFAAIVAFLAIYPYIINHFYNKNLNEISDYFIKKRQYESDLEVDAESEDSGSAIIPKIILFSVMYVALYYIIDKIAGVIFL